MPLRRHHQSPMDRDRTFVGDADAPRLRRVHRKSRAGCHECKRRHLKCDEARPACSRCAKGNRSCKYPESARNSTPPQPAPHNTELPQTNGTSGDADASPSPSPSDAVNDFVLLSIKEGGELPISAWPLTRHQMALLQHAKDSHLPYGSPADELTKSVVTEVMNTAWTAPYLMDLMLSLASLHLAELKPSQNSTYRQQAIQLQTRGLALFNEFKEDILPETCLPMFLFSSLIGTTVLYETLRHRLQFNDFLDHFVSYLHLHRGVSVVTAGAWYTIRKSQVLGIHIHFPSDEEAKALEEEGTECNFLDEMLEQSDLSLAAVEACRDTIQVLRSSFAIYHHLSLSTQHRSSSAGAFAVRVKSLFVDLVEQRQPEALVIVAHYAVLLHWCRDFWVYADGGEYIIRGISEHLGNYWHQWLIFPNGELSNET